MSYPIIGDTVTHERWRGETETIIDIRIVDGHPFAIFKRHGFWSIYQLQVAPPSDVISPCAETSMSFTPAEMSLAKPGQRGTLTGWRKSRGAE